MQFLRREEKREKIYSPRGRTKNKKKRNRSISRTRIYPLPGILQKKMAFALQINAAAATKKKTAAPKKTTVKKVRSCLFRAGLFPTGFRFFFLSLAQNGCLLQREEKKRDQKTNQKSATFASSRLCAFAPKNRPFDAVKRAHRTPKCTGSTSVRALTPRHPSRAGREDLSSGVCVFEKQKSKEICKVSFIEEASRTKTNRTMGKKRGRDFVFGPILIFFLVVSPQKREKIHPNTDHIFFFFFHSNPKQRPLMGGSYLCM